MNVGRKILSLFIAVVLATSAMIPINAEASGTVSAMKGVWISFQDIQTFLKGKDQQDFDVTFSAMCDKAAAQGCNTLFVHVRSHNDAIYPSAVYPWSTVMLNGDPGFDPLKDMVAIAHSKGLAFHAWINPYGYRKGVYCWNAALATNANILAGVQEIVTGYAVDGIHFDDYFPPVGTAVINSMVAGVHAICAANGKIFGISPQGNIENNRKMGADVVTWLSKRGYVDYICPQIYWTDSYGKNGNVTMFSNRLAAWKALDTAGIPMYVGLAAYRAGQPSVSDPGWGRSSSNLAGQVLKAENAGYGGYMIFSFSSMYSAPAQAELAALKTVR